MLKTELIRKLKETRPDTVGFRSKIASSEKASRPKAKAISIGGGAKTRKRKDEFKMMKPQRKHPSASGTREDLPLEVSMEADSDSDDTSESVEDSHEQVQQTVERKPVNRLDNLRRQEKISNQVGKVLKRLEGQISALKKSLIKKESKYVDKCFRCHEQGHKYADCKLAAEDSDQNVCYRCGSSDHRMRNCPAVGKNDEKGLPFVKCFVCGEKGHMSSKCPTKPKSKNVENSLGNPAEDSGMKSIKRKNVATSNRGNETSDDDDDVQDSDEEVQEIKKQKPDRSSEIFESLEKTPDRLVENNSRKPEGKFSTLKKSANKKGFQGSPKQTPNKSLENFERQEHTPDRPADENLQRSEEKFSTLKKSATRGYGEDTRQANWQKRRSNELVFSDTHSKKFQAQCFRCRQMGHKLADCKMITEDTDQGLDICFRCGSTEHKLSNCQNKAKKDKGSLPFAKCFVCGEQGHLSNTCPSNPKGAFPHGGSCNLCGSISHKQKDCPKQKENEDQDVTVKTLKTGVSADALD